MVFGRWRVSARIWLLVSLTLVGLLALCFTALFLLKGNMLEDRKQKTRNLVEVSVGMIASYEAQAKAGKLSEPAAKEAARESLRQVRYGGDNYYFILDRQHKYVLYPSKPEFEGQDKSDLKDANGKYLIRELVAAGGAGGGFVDYWFPKAGQQVAEPKLSYAAPAAWGWVVGTGIYIDDIETEYRQTAVVLAGISSVLLLALCAVGFMVAQSVLRQLGGEPVLAAEVMHRVAEGDLSASVGNPPQGSLLYALGEMLQSLRGLVTEINQEAGELLSDAAQLNQAATSVSSAAARQADSTAAVAAVTEELTVSSQHIAENAQDTERESMATMALAGEGNQKVVQASAAMLDISVAVSGAAERIRALEEQASNVSAMATVIKEIAGQTNLLALNAAIEAARAGELGRGFAVVADEVRKLAERASNSTAEIEQMIGTIQGDTGEAVRAMQAALPAVEQGVRLAAEAAESLCAIESGAARSLERVREVADATREQGSASTSIAQRMELIAQMTEETTATLRGTVETSNHLEGIATNLKRQIERFKTR